MTFLLFSASQSKLHTEDYRKETSTLGSNKQKKTFQFVESLQTPTTSASFLYQSTMDRMAYNNKKVSIRDESGGYFIKVGSDNVNMEISIKMFSDISSPYDMTFEPIQLNLLPDGTKQLVFYFQHLSKINPAKNEPKLNQIYVDLVTFLRDHTNFPQLEQQGQYLRALAKILEAAYFDSGNLSNEDKNLLDQLAFELIIVKEVQQQSDAIDNDESRKEEKELRSTFRENFQEGDKLFDNSNCKNKPNEVISDDLWLVTLKEGTHHNLDKFVRSDLQNEDDSKEVQNEETDKNLHPEELEYKSKESNNILEKQSQIQTNNDPENILIANLQKHSYTEDIKDYVRLTAVEDEVNSSKKKTKTEL